MHPLAIVAAALIAVVAGCGDDGAGTDAAVGGDGGVDAAPVECVARSFVAGEVISAGASLDLYGVGPGAWVAHAEDQAAPGAILYVEVYRDLFAGLSIDVNGFGNWLSECEACVFLGTGCASYDIPIGDTGTPAAPTHCDALFMLDRGAVELSAFDVDPSTGSLAGAVTPLDGDTSVHLVEVYREGDPSSPSGYGMMIPGGACLDVDSLSFDGAWMQLADAGVPDAGPVDAGVADATAMPDGGA